MDTAELNDKLVAIFLKNPSPDNFIEIRKKLIEFLGDLETYKELGCACYIIGEQYY